MIENWQTLLALLGIVASWSVIIIAALRVMFTRSLSGLEKEVAGFSDTTKACTALEREFLEFKATMPLEYVRREDFIRFEVGINYKLDKLRDLFLDTFKSSQGEK